MAINKVEYSGNTLIDLTSDSVTPESLLSGVTAHDASGNLIIGELNPQRIFDNAGYHNSIFRGKNLGTAVPEEQYEAISSGEFTDLYVGDYWTLNNVVYRIAGFDLFLHTGDTELTTHHVVIVPDKNMYSHVMNDTNVTTGGYYNSKMKQSGLTQALTTVKAAFGESHIVKRRVILTNATNGDNPSGWAWYDTYIDLMTERQVYGSPAWGQAAHNGYDAGCEYSRLPLFALAPEFITNREWYWLRDIRSSSNFAHVDGFGLATGTVASYSGGVRPLFLIS